MTLKTNTLRYESEGVTLENRIWLCVDALQILGATPYTSLGQQGQSKHVSISLKLGRNGLVINSILIKDTGKEGDSWFIQNWATIGDARLLDTPILHRGKRRSTLLLQDVIGKALYLFCTKGKGQILREFIQKGGEAPQFPFFKPEEWKGSLRIPVEFIRIRPSRYLDGKVYAHIQIGHHLILWSVLIYEKDEIKLYGNRILDPRLTAIIEQMLAREDVEKEISYACDNGRRYMNTEAEFIEAITGCDTQKTPPAIRFY